MSEDFEKLKKIGAQKIYEKTHISVTNIDYIFNKSFDKIPKVQFRGFISILEREYKLDLQDILADYEQHRSKDEEIVEYIKIDTKEYGKFDKKMILSALLVTLVIGYLIISSLTHSGSETVEANSTEIETAKANLDKNISMVDANETNSSEINSTAELNASDTNISVNAQKAPDVSQPIKTAPATTMGKATKLEIIPNKTLWLDYIDQESSREAQATINKNFDLNASKNYLIETGHAFMKIDLGSEIKEFSQSGKKYFKFENGELTELTRQGFKDLNKGKAW
ncbi:MAG: hypothetical protein PHX13_08570 [Thiovulaceae bacterium]|nr:hypothetical protein [Sulfurimonadaceae bacterium]